MAKRTWTSTSIPSDPLTDEQVRKRMLAVEDVDQKGLVKRHRVLGQTIFDILFIRDLICQGQHEAAHLFMDSMGKSGVYIRSASLDTEVFTPPQDIGSIIGERRMCFSSAYRHMVSDVGSPVASRTIGYFRNVYMYPETRESQRLIAGDIDESLSSLAAHYGTSSIHDVRDIIRSL